MAWHYFFRAFKDQRAKDHQGDNEDDEPLGNHALVRRHPRLQLLGPVLDEDSVEAAFRVTHYRGTFPYHVSRGEELTFAPIATSVSSRV